MTLKYTVVVVFFVTVCFVAMQIKSCFFFSGLYFVVIFFKPHLLAFTILQYLWPKPVISLLHCTVVLDRDGQNCRQVLSRIPILLYLTKMCDSRLSTEDAQEQASRLSMLDLYEDLLVNEDSQVGNRVLTMQEVVSEKKSLQQQNALLIQQLMETRMQVQKFAEEKANLQSNLDSLLATARVELRRKNDLLSRYINGGEAPSTSARPARTRKPSNSQSASKKKGLLELYKGRRVKDEELATRQSSGPGASANLSSTLLRHRGEKMVGVATRVIGSSFENLGDSKTTLAAINLSFNSPGAGSLAPRGVASADDVPCHNKRPCAVSLTDASMSSLALTAVGTAPVNRHHKGQTFHKNACVSKCDNIVTESVIKRSSCTAANRHGVAQSSEDMSGRSSTQEISHGERGKTDGRPLNFSIPKLSSMSAAKSGDNFQRDQSSRPDSGRKSSRSNPTKTHFGNLSDFWPANGQTDPPRLNERGEKFRRRSCETLMGGKLGSANSAAGDATYSATQPCRLANGYSLSLYESRRCQPETISGSFTSGSDFGERLNNEVVSKPKRMENAADKPNTRVPGLKNDLRETYRSKSSAKNGDKSEKIVDARDEKGDREKIRSKSRATSEDGLEKKLQFKSRTKDEKEQRERCQSKNGKKTAEKLQSKDSAATRDALRSKLLTKHGLKEGENSHRKSSTSSVTEFEAKSISSSLHRELPGEKSKFASFPKEQASCSHQQACNDISNRKRKFSGERVEMESSARKAHLEKVEKKVQKKKRSSKSSDRHSYGTSVNTSDNGDDYKISSSSARRCSDSNSRDSTKLNRTLKMKNTTESTFSGEAKVENSGDTTKKRRSSMLSPRKSGTSISDKKTVPKSFVSSGVSERPVDVCKPESHNSVINRQTAIPSVAKQLKPDRISRKVSLSDTQNLRPSKKTFSNSIAMESKSTDVNDASIDCLDLEFNFDENSLTYRDLVHPDDAELLNKGKEASKSNHRPKNASVDREKLVSEYSPKDSCNGHVRLGIEALDDKLKSGIAEKNVNGLIKTSGLTSISKLAENSEGIEKNSGRTTKQDDAQSQLLELPKYELKVCLVDIRKSVSPPMPASEARKRKVTFDSEQLPKKKKTVIQQYYSPTTEKLVDPSSNKLGKSTKNERNKMPVEIDSANAGVLRPLKNPVNSLINSHPAMEIPSDPHEKWMSENIPSLNLENSLLPSANSDPLTMVPSETKTKSMTLILDIASDQKSSNPNKTFGERSNSNCSGRNIKHGNGEARKAKHATAVSSAIGDATLLVTGHQPTNVAMSSTAEEEVPAFARVSSRVNGAQSPSTALAEKQKEGESPSTALAEEQKEGGNCIMDCKLDFVLSTSTMMMDVAMEVEVEPILQEENSQKPKGKYEQEADLGKVTKPSPLVEKSCAKTDMNASAPKECTSQSTEKSQNVAILANTAVISAHQKRGKKRSSVEKERRPKTARKKKEKPKKTLKIKMKAFKKDRKQQQSTTLPLGTSLTGNSHCAISITDVVASLPDVEDSSSIPEASPLLNKWLASARGNRWRKRTGEDGGSKGEKERGERKKANKCLKTTGENVEFGNSNVRETAVGSIVKPEICVTKVVKLEQSSSSGSQLPDSAYFQIDSKPNFQHSPCKQTVVERDPRLHAKIGTDNLSEQNKIVDDFNPILFPIMDSKRHVLCCYRNAAFQWLVRLATEKLRMWKGDSKALPQTPLNLSAKKRPDLSDEVATNQETGMHTAVNTKQQSANKHHDKRNGVPSDLSAEIPTQLRVKSRLSSTLHQTDHYNTTANYAVKSCFCDCKNDQRRNKQRSCEEIGLCNKAEKCHNQRKHSRKRAEEVVRKPDTKASERTGHHSSKIMPPDMPSHIQISTELSKTSRPVLSESRSICNRKRESCGHPLFKTVKARPIVRHNMAGFEEHKLSSSGKQNKRPHAAHVKRCERPHAPESRVRATEVSRKNLYDICNRHSNSHMCVPRCREAVSVCRDGSLDVRNDYRKRKRGRRCDSQGREHEKCKRENRCSGSGQTLHHHRTPKSNLDRQKCSDKPKIDKQKSPPKKPKPRRVALERVEVPQPQNEQDLTSPQSRFLWMSSLEKCQERRKQRARWLSEIGDNAEQVTEEHTSFICPVESTTKTTLPQSTASNSGDFSLSNLILDASLSSSWQLSEESRCRFYSFAKAVQALSPLKCSPLKISGREASANEEDGRKKVL